ncbi:hypothetical protein RKD23_001090 [Streptomyces sp. SAI-170]
MLEAASRVPFESVLPVQRFTSHRGQWHFMGWCWAATMELLVGFESWLERDRAKLLDHTGIHAAAPSATCCGISGSGAVP